MEFYPLRNLALSIMVKGPPALVTQNGQTPI